MPIFFVDKLQLYFVITLWKSYCMNFQMWDVSIGQGVTEYNEHKKRTWSVDFSQVDPTKFASGGDDCTLKIWNINGVSI